MAKDLRGKKTIKTRTQGKMQPCLVRSRSLLGVCLHVHFQALPPPCSFQFQQAAINTPQVQQNVSKSVGSLFPRDAVIDVVFAARPRSFVFLACRICPSRRQTHARDCGPKRCGECKQRCMQTRAQLSARGRSPTCCDMETTTLASVISELTDDA